MSLDMRTETLSATRRGANLLHVEADGCVVNIQVGLHDDKGHRVTRVDVIPDNYVGEEWDPDGFTHVRVIERKEAD